MMRPCTRCGGTGHEMLPKAYLDTIDTILTFWEREAVSPTAKQLASRMGVQRTTMQNRVVRLAAMGIIEGFHPHAHLGWVNESLHWRFTGHEMMQMALQLRGMREHARNQGQGERVHTRKDDGGAAGGSS